MTTMSVSRKRFRVEQAFTGEIPMPEPYVVEGGDIGPMHREIMAELRYIRAQMAISGGRPMTKENTEASIARNRRIECAARNLPRPDRAVRKAQGRARFDPRRHQPHQARDRGAARQEFRGPGDGQALLCAMKSLYLLH